MRARRLRRSSISGGDVRYARPQPESGGRSIAVLTALLLLVGLLAPYATIQTSLAAPSQPTGSMSDGTQQRENTPPPLEGVFSVTVGGEVAALIGNVALSPIGDGLWTASVAIAPGTYSYQIIVATNTGAVTLGQDGLPSPPANQATFTVPEGAQAATFVFNEFTGAIHAGGSIYELATDVGQFQMLPGPQGTFEVFFNAPPDTPINIQPLILGEPTGETAQVTAGDSGRVHVALNSAGQIQTAEAVQTATLDIVKTDQNGNPLGGACFTAYGGGNSVAAQACDSSDGAIDGAVRLNFPNGLPSGDVNIVETFTPDGQIVSEPQEIDLSSGAQQLQMIAQIPGQEEPPAEETPEEQQPPEEEEEPQVEEPPAEEPTGGFTLTFFAVDLNGNSLPGACFAIDGGEPVCDDDGDGAVVIPNVQPGTRTLSEPRSPDGFEPYPDIQLQITRDEQFSVPHNPGVSAQLPEDVSTINLQSVDDQSNLLPFACYELENGAVACDEDGDGIATFEDLPNGTYNATQTQTPEGFEPVPPFQLNVAGDADLQVPHQAVAAPEETEEPETPEAPEGFTIGFVSVDANQNGLPFACYSLDGGDPVCDEDGDGVVSFENVSPGLHQLTQTQAPEGFENVGTLDVNVEQDANFAVRHEEAEVVEEEPEPTPTQEQEEEAPGLTVGFVSVDQEDNGLPGACFTLDGGEEVCDDDGDAEVTFTGVQPGPHVLTQTRAPEGYKNVGELQLDLQNDGRFAVRHQPSVEPEPTEEPETPEAPAETGQIVAITFDQDGNTLPGVCYELSEFGQQCDGDDEDHEMTQEEVPPGDYTVTLVVPEGYEVVGETSQSVTVVAGEASEVRFQVQVAAEPTEAPEEPEEEETPPAEGTGAIAAVAVEDGFPILDACIAFEGPASGEVCDNQEGDADPAQGSVLISGLPAGSYQVAMPNPPLGFDPAPAVSADVTEGETTAVQLEVGGVPQEEPEAEETPEVETGNLDIFKVDVNGSPLGGACFQVGDGPVVCDNGEGDTDGLEGIIRIEGIPAGEQTVTETTAPEGYQPAASVATTIDAGSDAQLQVVNELIPEPLGSFRVIKREPDGTRLFGACFALIAADGSTLGPWCDDQEGDIDDRNGVIEILDIPVGDYTLTETSAPDGYIAAEDQPITITENERTSVTVMNALATGSVAIAKIDENGSPLGGACFLIGELEVCDDGDGDANAEPGIIQVNGITPGSVQITETIAPEGYVISGDPQTLEVFGNEIASTSFVNVRQSGSLEISKTDETGELLGGACFTIGDQEVCDNGEGDGNEEAGLILVSGVPVGTVTVAESAAPDGYAIADEPQSVDIVANETAVIDFANRLMAGTVVIAKTDDAGTPIGGACFSIGGQEVCDNGAGDENGEDGVLEVTGIPVGEVTVAEITAPEGYAPASDAQTVTVVDGEAVQVAFTNVRLVGTLRIEKTDESGSLLGGACFSVGESEICDNGEADANAEAGIIEVTGIGAGPVEVTETAAPEGYAAGESQTVDVIGNETTTVSVVNTRLTGAVQITTTSETGVAVGGACYAIDGQEVCDNDETDESGDTGVVIVSGVPTGEVTISQTLPPEGYGGTPEAQTVGIAADEIAQVGFSNAALVGGVRIEKVDENGTPVGGSCFAVGPQRVCDNDENDGNGEDGVIEVTGLPIGPVSISETTVPAGYASDGFSQTVQITAGQMAGAAFLNTRLTGSVRIDKVDQDGAPLGGACFLVGELAVCDDADGDTNPDPGVIEVSGVPIGTITVSETSAPEGYAADGTAQTIDIAVDETTSITVTNTRLLGGIRIEKTDENGDPLAGACFSVGGQEICDNGDGDTNEENGIIEVGGIPVGPVDILETVAPEGYGAAAGVTVQVPADDVVTATLANTRLVSGIRILKTDENGETLGGACFAVAGQDVCDNGDGDLNSDGGVIEIGNIPTGNVEILETSAPDGYVAGGSTSAEVEADAVTEVTIANERAVGTVSISKTDQNGEALSGACFTVGDLSEVCDNSDGDLNEEPGVVDIGNVPTGAVVIAETTAPEGYSAGEAQTVEVAEGETTTVSFVNVRQVGSLTILKTDQDDNPLGGACFTLRDLTVCDDGDGDANPEPGVIEMGGVPTGTFDIVESTIPEGYTGGDAQNVTVGPDEPVTVTFVNVRQVGELSIIKTDQNGVPLAGSCFAIGDLTVCDDGDGDVNSDPGMIHVTGVPSGEATITETTVPEGYAAADPQTVVIETGETITVSFTNIRQVGNVTITKTDQDGEPVGGACFTIGDLTVCDDGEGDLNEEPGVVEVIDVPSGEVVISESTAPEGYAGSDPQTVIVETGETITVSFTNVRQLGNVTITKTDQDGEPLGGACFTVRDLTVCDDGEGDLNEETGVIEIADVPTGEVVISESTVPEGYAGSDPQTVVVETGETITVSFTNVRQLGNVTITKTDQDGEPLGGACFTVRDLTVCDDGEGDLNEEPGVVEVIDVPSGEVMISESTVPEGYTGSDPQSIVVETGETIVISFTNVRQLGNVTITKTDQDGEPLGGACFTVRDLTVCDDGEGDGNDEPGVIEMSGIPTGEVTVRESTAPEGYGGSDPQVVEVLADETAFVEFTNVRQIGNLTITKTDQDGEPLAGACFTIGELTVCDNDEGDLNDEPGVVDVVDLPSGDVQVSESTVPEGYSGSEPQTIEIITGETATAAFTNVRQMGNVTITKVDEQGEPLGGSCFTIDDLTVCDNGDGDGNDETGVIAITGVPTGEVTVRESTVPEGYAPSDPQRIEVEADETATVTFTNVREVGSITITKADQDGEAVGGACFTVDGVTVCDDGDDDGSDEPGVIVVTGIPTGTVVVTESTVPEGYAGADPQTIEIIADETSTAEFTNVRLVGNLTITKTDQDGEPLGGACFTVRDLTVCDDGEGDGNDEPGVIEMSGIPTGEVTVRESTAPEGYAGSDSQDVEILANETVSVEFTNVRQTGNLTITKTDQNGESLGGACFTVGDLTVCDDEEGDGNDEPGVIEISGIPTGEVEVVESTVPDGYAGSDPQTVEIVTGETAELTVQNDRLVGVVSIIKNDENGDPLGGACFTIGEISVCDNEEPDQNDAEGLIEVGGVPTGSVDVVETTAPEGHAIAPAQNIDVVADETVTVTFVNELLVGTVQILKTNPDGEPLAGACFLVDGQEICDNGEGDEDDDDGVIVVSQIAIGPIVVSETVAPEGYSLPPDPQTVDITANETVNVTFVNELAVGRVSITKTDEAGESVAGACFLVGEITVCDDGEGDENTTDGIVEVSGVPVGTVEVTETTAPEGYVAAPEPQSVDVLEGETVSLTFVNALAVGTVLISVVDADGELLPGACFTIGDTEVCDNGEGDQDDTEGMISVADVPVGTPEVAQTQAPEGYVASTESQTVDVALGEQSELTFNNPLAVGSIRILKTDDDDQPLGGACFTIGDGEPVCDNGEGDRDSATGVISITVPVGEYTVVESQAPEGYDAITEPATVGVSFGEISELTFVNTRFTGSLMILKTDNTTGAPLAGACFAVEGETSYGPICDNEDGDADPADGAILIQGIEPDAYTVTETTTPDGFEEPGGPVAESLVISGGSEATLEVANEPEGQSVRPVLPPTGALTITKVDEAGEPVGGACFALSGAAEVGPVCDDDPADLDPNPGTIQIGTVPTGEYTLSETTTPPGYSGVGPRTVEILLDEPTTIEVVNTTAPAEPGSLRIRTLDEEGDAVGGACFSWGTGSQCDNTAGDLDPAIGEILVAGLTEGDYTVTGTEPPAGMLLADPLTVEITAGQEAVLEFSHEAAPEETGGLEFELTDPNGNPVEGACVSLSDVDNVAEDLVLCDGGEEDTNPDPGILVVENLPVGTYSVRQAALPGADSAQVAGVSFKMQVTDGATVPTALQAVSEKTVQVKANVIVVVIIIIIVDPPQAGGLDIVKRSQDTNILQPGACFEISGQGNTIEICDNDGVDANMSPGVIRFVNLAEGIYTITETQSPPGYDPAEDSEAAVVGGLVTTITIKDPPTPDPLGDLLVLKVDPEGEPVSGTCFEVRQGADLIAGPVCDEDDGDDDGSITFANLEPGNYTLRETQAASDDYQPIPDQPFSIQAGQVTEVPVVNTLKPGSILITKLDDEGNGPLPGACFGLDRGDGIEFEVCDQQSGDGDLEEGIILIGNVPPGNYDLIETAAPSGFDPGPSIPVTVEPDTQLLLEIENTPSTPPADTGDLTIIKRNSQGEPLPGACFALRQGPVIKVPARCDGDDGNLDGQIRFTDVGVGQYGVIETKKPSADYQTPPEKFVTVTKDSETQIVIVNVLKRGRILITKVNQQDQPLSHACFKVTPGFFAQKCTNGSGQVVFDNLPPGVYTVTETQAPYGYLAAPPVTNVVVKPGLTTPVKIVNQKAPPPPDAGSLRVIKFFCPLVGDAEELWAIYDSSDANQKTLAQTANCKKGDATFVLKPTDGGDIISIKFQTGADGIAHLNLPAGTYTLTELATGVTTQVRVFVSQQTTVVVLNYIPPPEPKPAAINVFKFTCDAGFQGQFYLDFIGACGGTENLTNNVTFRISGATIATRVTGDGGLRGQTRFTQLPGGLYLLREDTPPTSGQTYMWCGLELDSYEFGAVGNQIAFPLELGQTMYCAAFNVPDQVTDTTGSIVVQKFACELPPVKRPANFDWFAECGLQTTGAKFGLSELVEGLYVPRLTGVTNVNGLLTFEGLKPGTYKLQEIGADWCHAESDSVNATGDVIVKAGQRSNVWIFNCIPTVGPPNTGAGTTAGVLLGSASIAQPDLSSTAAVVLIWPVLAALGLAARRRWLGGRKAA